MVAKRPSQPGDEARLRHEAEVLGVARHPGVVELGELTQGEDGDLELTAFAVRRGSLMSHCLVAEEAAGLVAAAARIVGDLHDHGIAHGDLRPEHILVGDGGRPILCGFGSSTFPGSVTDKAADVQALARLLTELAIPADRDVDILRALRKPSPGILRRRSQSTPPAEAVAARLTTIAAWAAAPHPEDQPSARELADALQRRVPGARLPGGDAATGGDAALDGDALGGAIARRVIPRRLHLHRLKPRSAMSGGCVALILVLVVVTTRSTMGNGRARSAESTAPHTSLAMTTAASPCPSAPGPLQGDLDGDGCDEALSYRDGVLTNGTARIRVGDAADRVTTGRWTCGAGSDLALLQPTGDVYVFPGWAKADQPISARLAGHVDGAVDLAPVDTSGDGCDEIAVTAASGATATIDPRQPS